MKPTHYILLNDHSIEPLYIFDENDTIIEESLNVWWEFYKDIERRRIGYDIIGNITVSTVFIGLNHSCYNDEPALFESTIFENGNEKYCKRYYTWEEAQEGHIKIVEYAKKQTPK